MKVLLFEFPGEYQHGLGCKNRVLQECPSLHWTEELTEETTLYIYLGSYYDAFEFAVEHGFDLINIPYAFLSPSFNRQFAPLMLQHDIWIIRAHCQNEHNYSPGLSCLDYVVAVGGGDSIGNTFSYGPGLEFYVQETCQSWATARVTGMFAQLLIDHPDWSFWHARAALRQTASHYASGQGWSIDEIDASHDKGGFGELNPQAATQVTEFALFGPLGISVAWHPPELHLQAFPWPGPGADLTVIWQSSVLPGRDATPDPNAILFQGGQCQKQIYFDGDDAPFICFQTRGSCSKLEANEIIQQECFLIGNELWYQKPAPEKTFIGSYLLYPPFFEICTATIKDLSGLCTDLQLETLNATHPAQLTPQKFDNSLHVYGDSFHLLADSTELRSFWPRTFVFWFKLFSDARCTFFDFGDDTHFSFGANQGLESFFLHLYPGTTFDLWPENGIPLNTWNFIALVVHSLFPWDKNQIYCWFQDHRPDDPYFASDWIEAPLGRFSLGAAQSQSPSHFEIADFRMFAHALTQNEFLLLQNHGMWRTET